MPKNHIIESILLHPNDIESLRKAIQNHPDDINEPDPDDYHGHKPFLLACLFDLKIAELLFAHGADKLSKTNFGFNALDIVILTSQKNRKTKYQFITWLTEIGLKFHSDLHYAAFVDDRQKVEEILQQKPNIGNKIGISALHYALAAGNFVIARMLLQAGADINVKDLHGDTPLHHAVVAGQIKTIKFLIRKRADIDALNTRGESSLFKAAEYNQFIATTLLVDEGADLDLSNWLYLTPFTVAVQRGHAVLAKFLLRKIAKNPDKETALKPHEQRIPILHLAVHFGQAILAGWILEFCKENSIPIRMRDDYSRTLLHYAAIAIKGPYPGITDLKSCLKIWYLLKRENDNRKDSTGLKWLLDNLHVWNEPKTSLLQILNTDDAGHRSGIEYAAANGFVNNLEILCDKYPPSLLTDKQLYLHLAPAFMNHQVAVIQRLLEKEIIYSSTMSKDESLMKVCLQKNELDIDINKGLISNKPTEEFSDDDDDVHDEDSTDDDVVVQDEASTDDVVVDEVPDEKPETIEIFRLLLLYGFSVSEKLRITIAKRLQLQEILASSDKVQHASNTESLVAFNNLIHSAAVNKFPTLVQLAAARMLYFQPEVMKILLTKYRFDAKIERDQFFYKTTRYGYTLFSNKNLPYVTDPLITCINTIINFYNCLTVFLKQFENLPADHRSEFTTLPKLDFEKKIAEILAIEKDTNLSFIEKIHESHTLLKGMLKEVGISEEVFPTILKDFISQFYDVFYEKGFSVIYTAYLSLPNDLQPVFRNNLNSFVEDLSENSSINFLKQMVDLGGYEINQEEELELVEKFVRSNDFTESLQNEDDFLQEHPKNVFNALQSIQNFINNYSINSKSAIKSLYEFRIVIAHCINLMGSISHKQLDNLQKMIENFNTLTSKFKKSPAKSNDCTIL